MHKKLEVREMEMKDVKTLTNYWLKSEPDFLVGMGVDLKKLPNKEQLTEALTNQINLPLQEKTSYALIWLVDDTPAGHTNVNSITFGESAFMHLHLWNSKNRQSGIGTALVEKSLPFFFKNLNLEELFCQPYALNPAPNKTLAKVGFEFEKKYTTIPGSLNFEQEVNLWKMTKANFNKIKSWT